MSFAIGDMVTLNAAFKVQYADKMESLVPDMTPLMSKLPFVKAESRHGSTYIQPVVLSMDHGFTCHGPADNVLDLNAPSMAQIQQANVTSSAYTARSWISYTVLSRATGGPQAFIDATSYHVESLTRSFAHASEQVHWYGGLGLATITGVTARMALKQVGVSAGQLASFNFLGGEGMPIDIYDSTSTSLVLSTKISKVLIGSSDAGTTKDGGATLTLEAALSSTLVNGTEYVIHRKGFNGLEGKGVFYILATDNVFGINGANYGLWAATRASAGGALSFSVLSSAIANGIARGCTGPLDGYVNPKAFRQLMPDFVGLGTTTVANYTGRRLNGEECKSLVHGTKSMKFYVDTVELNLEASEFVKGEDCALMDKGTWSLVGSTKMTFDPFGSGNGYLRDRPDSSACEIRAFADNCVFASALNRSILINGITY